MRADDSDRYLSDVRAVRLLLHDSPSRDFAFPKDMKIRLGIRTLVSELSNRNIE